MTIKRYLPSAALAFGVTCGLGLFMAGMIKTEFTPQEKSEIFGFEINPQVEEIKPPADRKPPKPLEDVETPPPPPIIDKGATEKVKVPPVILDGNWDVFDTEIILVAGPVMIPIDKDEQPILRVPLQMPLRAEQSGHCKVKFDVTAQGQTMNVRTTYCTQSLFSRPTIKSVQKWKFSPGIMDGRPVSREKLTNIVRYNLTDERGNLIPE